MLIKEFGNVVDDFLHSLPSQFILEISTSSSEPMLLVLKPEMLRSIKTQSLLNPLLEWNL